MKLTGLSNKVFLDRYALKDKKGNPLEKTPEQMWKRVAKAVAQIEPVDKRRKWEKKFYWAMKNFKYVPGGRILAGAGTGFSVTYYNCFVIPSPKDSRGGILETLKQMVEIMARGGGVGINLSSLRPRGERVKKVNGFSSGPVNWAELFSVTTKDIIQQGGSRRGALMLMLWDWHPDIEEFITVKEDLNKITGANLSIAVSDSFMKAVKEDKDWALVFPDIDDPDYDDVWDGNLNNWKKLGKKVVVHKVVKARKLWDLIAKAAWKSAEPGVVFMERYNKLYNNYYWNHINCVNPCGEEGLPPFGVCNLGSINLSALVKFRDIDKKGRFDFKTLREVVRVAVRFQDNVVEMDPYVFDGIRKTQLEGERRIGVGTMGLGDALIKLHLRYGSKRSLKFIEKVYKIIRDEAYKMSIELAKEKGSFPKFEKDPYLKGKFIETLPDEIKKGIAKHGIRNSLLLMQAPTGSTSLLANTTSGIEPVFEFEMIRHDRLGDHVIQHHLWKKWVEKHGEEFKKGKTKVPDWFVTSKQLTPEEHVEVQAIIQKYVDASISKTVNAPETHTVEDVKKLYELAYDKGCKGITYFREGSREGVLETKKEKKDSVKNKLPSYVIKPRPMVVHGSTYRIETPVGTAFVTINTNGGGEPLEVFVNVGKAGSDVYAMAEGMGRLISLALRFSSHLSPQKRVSEIVDQLKGIGGARTLGFGKDRIRSLPDALAKVLTMHFKLNGKGYVDNVGNHDGNGNSMMKKISDSSHEKEEVRVEEQTVQPMLMEFDKNKAVDICPICGQATLVNEEGCKKCYNCGYSEC